MNPFNLLWTSMLLFTPTATKIKVFQKPTSIVTTEGNTIHLLCTYNTSHAEQNGAFSWHKNVRNGSRDTRVTNKSKRYTGRIVEVDRPSFKANRNASIAIKNVKQEDSGIYYCQVEILFGEKQFGPGTILTVEHQKQRNNSGSSILWELIKMGVKLAVFALFIIGTISLVHCYDSRGSAMTFTSVREEVDSSRTCSMEHG